MNMQTLNINIKTDDKQMAIIHMSEYIGLREQLDELVEMRLLERNREQDKAIPHSFVHRVIDGENPIKVYREWRGLNQKQLADACHTTQANIGKIERWQGIGTAHILLKIAYALNVDAEHLIHRQCQGYEKLQK